VALPHAILVSLCEQAGSGYELAHRFDRSIGYFWAATHQQIYRELARMAEAAWVAVSENGNSSNRRRKLYHVLPAGREELVKWVSQPSPPRGNRRAFLVKIRAEAVIGPLGVDRELSRLIGEHQACLDTYREIEQRDFLIKEMSAAAQLHYAVLQSGIIFEEAWLKWASQVLPLLHATRNCNGEDLSAR